MPWSNLRASLRYLKYTLVNVSAYSANIMCVWEEAQGFTVPYKLPLQMSHTWVMASKVWVLSFLILYFGVM